MVQGTVNQEVPTTKKKEVPPLKHLLTVLGQCQRSLGTVPERSWDSAKEVLGQCSLGTVLGQCSPGIVLDQSSLGTVLGQYSLGTVPQIKKVSRKVLKENWEHRFYHVVYFLLIIFPQKILFLE